MLPLSSQGQLAWLWGAEELSGGLMAWSCKALISSYRTKASPL